MIKVENNESFRHKPNICVIGIGGGGNNAIDRMLELSYENVNYISMNTDFDVLSRSHAPITVQLGPKTTKGFGAGTDPAIGEAAAIESENEIREVLANADMTILTCGLGGGTGTGAISVIADICMNMGILTLAIVTLPFSFEGLPRREVTDRGLEELKPHVDTLFVVPNDKLLTLSDKPVMLNDAFLLADNVLKHTIWGITNIVFNIGTINLDFNDLNKLFRGKGIAHLGIGISNDRSSVIDAVKQAIEAPLLDTNIQGASTILLNTSGQINLNELNEAASYVQDLAGKSTNIIWGTVTAEDANESEIVVTLIATGLSEDTTSDVNKTKLPPIQPDIVTMSKDDYVLTIPTFLTKYRRSK